MKLLTFMMLAMSGLANATMATAADQSQTIVLIRHGEKPEQGLGQLSCQGLNRSLALPAVLKGLFGPPSAIFVPNPSRRKTDGGHPYDYIRPLATIEPTAIAAGLPVNSDFGYDDVAGLKAAISTPELAGKVVFIAWEHKQIEALATALVRDNGGDPTVVPKWHGKDFDSIYVVNIDRRSGSSHVQFRHLAEGLDGQSPACPAP